MIKKLRVKFMIVMISVLLVFFAIVLLSINYASLRMGDFPMDRRMRQIAVNDGAASGMPPPHIAAPENYQDALAGFSVRLDENGNITDIISDGKTELPESEVRTLVDEALAQGGNRGVVGTHRFLITDKAYGRLIVFLDNSFEENVNYRLRTTSILIGSASFVVLLVISYFLSRWIVRPVAENFEKQKEFISNASHELKTPLAVISTNADVLQNEIGDNKWLSYIKSETGRMSSLVNSLLSLARLDDGGAGLVLSQVDFSDAVLRVALPFESVAFEAKISYRYDIESGVVCRGNADSLSQLASILIDNAIKNANENGEVRITLAKKGAKAVLEVYNTGRGIESSERAKIFERFYRSESGGRDGGGYGLGLAIASAIVKTHKGRISVQSKPGEWAKFTVVI